MSCRFYTEWGLEVPAVTSEQMREVDRIAVEETGPNLFQMMENAGRNLAELTRHVLGSGWKRARVLVLAGHGGNGGGGLCGGRHLANHEMNVEYCLAGHNALGTVPQFQRRILLSTRAVEVSEADLPGKWYDLVVDALIGYGLRSAPSEEIASLIRWANGSHIPILSLDMPSGVDATTGEKPGIFIRPQWTLTLALPKTGLRPDNSTELFLADIGIPAKVFQRLGIEYVSPFTDRYWIPLKMK